VSGSRAGRIERQLLELALAGDRSTGSPHPAGRAVPTAAVAAIFAPGRRDTELLFIERATRAGDPWSGHMAFPGGRSDPADLDTRHTAERETREELGLDLAPAAWPLGSLSEIDGGRASNRPIVVSSHCYWLPVESRPDLAPNHEVTDVVWVPLSDLLDRKRYIEYRYPPAGMAFPGIQLDNQNQVIWGLTLRMLGDLFGRLQREFII
jgi:8-oxo-dGTP pyrophosphatase MutT (NUDIX family)